MLISKVGPLALAIAVAIPVLSSGAAIAGNANSPAAAQETLSNGERIRTAPIQTDSTAPATNNRLRSQDSDANQNPGGPRAPGDRIDMSVCDLATFDEEKCLLGG